MSEVDEEVLVPTKKPGNPNFGKQKTGSPQTKYDPKKRYQFQLAQIVEKAKPRDRETGEMVDNPYPPIFISTNEGEAIHPKTGLIETWRYLFGYSSIWVKDQVNPKPGKRQLENPKNFIEFKNGSMFVMGTNTALMDAMMIQDQYEGVVNPINQVPPVYKLVDLAKDRKVMMDKADLAYEAEKTAREASFEEMLPVAQHFGIDVDHPEEDKERIRSEFIFKAKQDPIAFSKQFVNPKVKFKYNIVQGLRANIISSNIVPGKMVLVDTQRVYFDVKEGDSAEQFASLLIQNNQDAVKLYEQMNLALQG